MSQTDPLPPEARFIPPKDLTIDRTTKLGTGGFGVVFAGQWRTNRVAVKYALGMDTAKNQRMFRHEVSVWFRLDHPNIVKLWGISTCPLERELVMVIQRMETSVYRRIYDEVNSPSFEQRVQWLLETADALQFLHEQKPPLIHADLKPDNILIDNTGRACVSDFGLARVQQLSTSYTINAYGALVYAPPESFILGNRATTKHDTYCFGMTMFETLGTSAPFFGETQARVPQWVTEGLRPSRPMDPAIPEYCWELIVKCWDQDPVVRPSFGQVFDEIQGWNVAAKTEGEPFVDEQKPRELVNPLAWIPENIIQSQTRTNTGLLSALAPAREVISGLPDTDSSGLKEAASLPKGPPAPSSVTLPALDMALFTELSTQLAESGIILSPDIQSPPGLTTSSPSTATTQVSSTVTATIDSTTPGSMRIESVNSATISTATSPIALKDLFLDTPTAAPTTNESKSNSGDSSSTMAPAPTTPPQDQYPNITTSPDVSTVVESTPTPHERTCNVCNLSMSGRSVKALGQFYHEKCFCCVECHIPVVDKFFPLYAKDPDGKPLPPALYCETHYFALHGLLCDKCGRALRGPHINAMGKKFHLDHFSCAVCSTVFRQHDSYYERDSKVYCQFHYSILFASSCGGCETAVLQKFVEMKKEGVIYQWHPQCYMIYKLWNVKPNFQHVNTLAIGEANPEDEITCQSNTLTKVDNMLSILSSYEDSAAKHISDMLLHFADGRYSEMCLDGHYLLEYVDAMFTGLEVIDQELVQAGGVGIL
ncbi:hypothetical protein HDU98_000878, partial [Podochytrium sp. JEL0797]